MRKYKFVNVKQKQLIELSCSVCGLNLMDDELEKQEAVHFGDTGGYSSVFGDGVTYYIDICQHCFKKILGKYCTIVGE